MHVIYDTIKFSRPGPCAITLGKFDGVHRGHRALVDSIQKYKNEENRGAETVVFSFDAASATLLTKEERRAMLEEIGVDCLIECPFVPEIITTEAEDFVKDILVQGLHAAYIAVGPDFHFGYKRMGDTELLRKLGKQYGFRVEVISRVTDHGREISSTRIRKCLEKGEMERVGEMLGYPFFVTGPVLHGKKIGRTLGFPTANLIPGKDKLLPPNGVYAVRSAVGGRSYCGITDIGTKPTVDGQFVGVETYLYGCDESTDLYGEKQKVELLHFLRPEKKFASLEALKIQIEKDRESGKAFFPENGQSR
ncbi:MAG TPA: bifunctional riboflavin kinase/FAD synthetase [Lachnospiraceae bacterium]|nr:bifunctional riboflavin kinase/FAD synthetase [Lachnospiraceae bacterium]